MKSSKKYSIGTCQLNKALDSDSRSYDPQKQHVTMSESINCGEISPILTRFEPSDENVKLTSFKHNTLDSFRNKTFDDEKQIISSKNNRHNDQFIVSWYNLNYVVEANALKRCLKLDTDKKQILRNICGSFKSNQISAVLGPSGSGKSTLIDCLLGKHDKGLTGRTRVTFHDKLLEGERRKERPLKIALIPQKDYLMDTLTVEETLMYASRMKNAHLSYDEEREGRTTCCGNKLFNLQEERKKFDHKACVDNVLKLLHLEACASVRCGQLSGGQYKRVSIGQEMLSRPDIMILDEPTSGLDSVTCFRTIKALKQLIEDSPYPIAVLATIHQPDIEVFNLFHKVYVLAPGGRALYEGLSGAIFSTVKEAMKTFHSKQTNCCETVQSEPSTGEAAEDIKRALLHERLNDRWCNPARLIIELASGKFGEGMIERLNEIQSKKHQDNLENFLEPSRKVSLCGINSYASSDQLANSSQLEESQLNLSHNSDFKFDPLLCLVAANVNQKRSLNVHLKHLLVHTERTWKTILRNPLLFSLQLFLHSLVPILIAYTFKDDKMTDGCPKLGNLDIVHETFRNGTILDDLNDEISFSIQNASYLFMQSYVIIFGIVCITSLVFPFEMHVLLKEYRNRYYSLITYFFGRTFADTPIPVANVIQGMTISYYLSGQPSSEYEWRYICITTLTVLATLVGQTTGLIFGALLMDAPQAAVFAGPLGTAPLIVVSGFLVRIRAMPYILQLSARMSYFTYLLNGAIISRYGFNKCPCDEEDFATDSSHDLPPQTREIMNVWIETFSDEYSVNTTTEPVDVIGKLVDTISKAKTFNHQMLNCSQVKPFNMLDYELDDNDLLPCFVALIVMIFIFRWFAYLILSWKIKSSL